MKQPVLSKSDFYKRFLSGEFGNMLRTWKNIEEFKKSKYNGLVSVRSKSIGGKTRYNIPSTQVENIFKNEDVIINEAAPDHLLIIQGEVMESVRFIELLYSPIKNRMKIALKKKSILKYGISALKTIQYCMDTHSYDWIRYLIHEYKDHVVEFSCYSQGLGTLGFNTIIWEVRKY